ncbi:MAG: hypothetical protein ACI808_003269 [Paraglaciecola sp.]|jgi:hypothetical protein
MSRDYRSQDALSKSQDAELNSLDNSPKSDEAVFSTAEYFNKAEQEIEKSLLRSIGSFQV